MAKSKVLNRPMFKGAEMSDEPVIDAENVGIMSGFKDLFEDDDEEMDEDEMEMSQIMGRTPDSPEILMNNLRGDMRSIDARRDELADLVGYQAATETPEPVLAMLQPVLAAQGGIGALPQPGAMPPGPPPGMMPPSPPGGMPPPGMMPPDMGMPPPGAMPPGPPPEMSGGIGALPTGMARGGEVSPNFFSREASMPPLRMANGGMVQYFSNGSDGPDEKQDGGVSPVNYPPALRSSAESLVSGLFSQKPETIPSLGPRAEELSKEYASLLGSSKNQYQGQALLDLGRLFFGYAGNVDPETGKQMRGSPFARFAQTARAAPGVLGKYAGEIGKEDRELKLLGLKSAQAEKEAILERNARLIEEKRKAAVRIVEQAGKNTSRFSKSDFGYEILTQPGLLSDWAVGKADPEQDMLVQSAITDLLKPITEDIIDPKNNQIIGKRVKPGTMMPFVKDALTQWGDRQGLSYDDTIKLFTDPTFRLKAKAAVGQAAPVTTTTPAPSGTGILVPGVSGAPAVAQPAPPTTGGSELTDVFTLDKGESVPVGKNFDQVSANFPGDRLVQGLIDRGILKEQPKGLFWEFGKISGPASGIANVITSIPGLGDPYAMVSKARDEALIAQEGLISAFIKGTNKGEQEQRRVEERYRLKPDSFEDPYKLRNRIVAFDEEIRNSIRELQRTSNSLEIGSEQRRDADRRIADLQSIRRKLNVPPVAYTNEEVAAFPPGTVYLWKGTQFHVTKPRKEKDSGKAR